VDRTADQDKLEKKISDITSKDRGVILRNITKEKENIQSMRKKTQINNMGIISILFIITISNIINNIGYNILSRTNEFGMLRAIGLNDEDFKKMIIFEGLLYGIISSIIVLVSSLIIQMIIYDKSNISSIGIDFKIRYIDYITVITLNLILGAVTTYFQSKKFRGSSIIECMNKVE
jgi:ABC-type antimicrobial peptide transport system permease subunit